MKEHFPQLQNDFVYLDSAATTLKPKCVIEALTHFYSYDYATIHRGLYSSAQKAGESYYQIRVKVQKLLKAEFAEEIIFTRSTTQSINLLAHSFSEAFLTEQDCVIISETEHHANVVPWQMASEKVGFLLLFVRVHETGEIDLSHLAELLASHRVKLVSICHVSNVTGAVQPIEKIITMAHHAGALVALDGAQAAAHMAIDVTKWDIDFYAFSAHKLYGPTGVGVLYGKRKLLEQMPPYEGGGDMIAKVTQDMTTYAPLPHKFEAGTPAIGEVIAFGAALDFVQDIGYQAIYEQMNLLREDAYQKLHVFPGLRFIGVSKSALLTFTIEGKHPLDVALWLDCKNIAVRTGHLCSQLAMQRFGITESIRISFGIYNTIKDIDILVETLDAIPLY